MDEIEATQRIINSLKADQSQTSFQSSTQETAQESNKGHTWRTMEQFETCLSISGKIAASCSIRTADPGRCEDGGGGEEDGCCLGGDKRTGEDEQRILLETTGDGAALNSSKKDLLPHTIADMFLQKSVCSLSPSLSLPSPLSSGRSNLTTL